MQSNEAGNSNRMELMGLKETMDFFEQKKLEVESLVTDRHPSIIKYVRENFKKIHHFFDTWHVAKGLSSLNLFLIRFIM